MSQLSFLTLACVVGFVAAGPIDGPCCLKKTVGNVSYTIVEQTDTSEFDCLSNCVYEQDGVPGSRFCFAQGELPVVCNGIGKPHEAIFCGEDLKKLLDGFSEKNTTAAARCCTKDTITRCYGHDCTDVCDVEVKCLKLVPYGDLSNDEHCRKDRMGTGLIDMVLGYWPGMCAAPASSCPTIWNDARALCCRSEAYDAKCRTYVDDKFVDHCKCMVTCDWMARRKICYKACSWCCSCPNYYTACLTTCKTGNVSPQPFTGEPDICDTCPTGNDETCCDKCNDPYYRGQCANECKCNCFCKTINQKKSPPWVGCWADWSTCCECKKDEALGINYGNYENICDKQVCDATE